MRCGPGKPVGLSYQMPPPDADLGARAPASSSVDSRKPFRIPPTTIPKKIPDQNPPRLVYDKIEPPRFRTTSDTSGLERCDSTGFHGLSLSGSAQFSERQLEELITLTHPKRLVIVDTRQEFHGFANGEPISWFAADNHNWGNVEKPADIIPAKETKKLAKLPTKFPFGLTIESGSVVKGKASSAPPMVLDFGEVKIETEEELVKRKGVAYLRIPTPDHARPTDAEIDKLVSELRNLAHAGDVHLHFHCRGGMGRTTLLMTLADMLYNADKVQCADIIERQIRLRRRDESTTSKAAKEVLRNEKSELMDTFFQYAKEQPLEKAEAISWTEWLALKARHEHQMFDASSCGMPPTAPPGNRMP
ncbi:hypothetical protein CWO89_44645 [Bradyrhizobium sp. Leo170]|nr:hypothetical protein CWO90_46900 [Bradyrhizobium sp. Leo121]TAI59734.1 hypothetical protein CWO89_44645 [Bradyrhizobium sp. Leo170]